MTNTPWYDWRIAWKKKFWGIPSHGMSFSHVRLHIVSAIYHLNNDDIQGVRNSLEKAKVELENVRGLKDKLLKTIELIANSDQFLLGDKSVNQVYDYCLELARENLEWRDKLLDKLEE